MTLAPWRTSLSRAIHRNRSKAFSRYFQLATVTPEGKPANRTVVFRGFRDDSNQLKVVVDTRSDKIEQIHHQPWGEICWYFTETREQFRLAGELILVTGDHADPSLTQERQQTWENLSDSARSQFVWSHPGQPRQADDPAFSNPPPDEKEPLSNFALLLLVPKTVDHLELRGDPQNRYLYNLDKANSWKVQAVNP
jgi:pyridoxamine 5'-phosphate oxidase